jgi:hypothetical protein
VLKESIAVSYEPVERDGRKGLLEFVTTKGGGSESRPSQKSVEHDLNAIS